MPNVQNPNHRRLSLKENRPDYTPLKSNGYPWVLHGFLTATPPFEPEVSSSWVGFSFEHEPDAQAVLTLVDRINNAAIEWVEYSKNGRLRFELEPTSSTDQRIESTQTTATTAEWPIAVLTSSPIPMHPEVRQRLANLLRDMGGTSNDGTTPPHPPKPPPPPSSSTTPPPPPDEIDRKYF